MLSETLRPQDVEVSYTYLSGYQSVGCLKTVIEFLVAVTAGSGRTTRQYSLHQETFSPSSSFIRSLSKAQEMKAKLREGVCPSVDLFNLKNSVDTRFSWSIETDKSVMCIGILVSVKRKLLSRTRSASSINRNRWKAKNNFNIHVQWYSTCTPEMWSTKAISLGNSWTVREADFPPAWSHPTQSKPVTEGRNMGDHKRLKFRMSRITNTQTSLWISSSNLCISEF